MSTIEFLSEASKLPSFQGSKALDRVLLRLEDGLDFDESVNLTGWQLGLSLLQVEELKREYSDWYCKRYG